MPKEASSGENLLWLWHNTTYCTHSLEDNRYFINRSTSHPYFSDYSTLCSICVSVCMCRNLYNVLRTAACTYRSGWYYLYLYIQSLYMGDVASRQKMDRARDLVPLAEQTIRNLRIVITRRIIIMMVIMMIAMMIMGG